MNDFALYYVDPHYIENLHNIDKKVELHHGTHNKPYLGIIFKIANINYFVPLSSAKPKHAHMHDGIIFIKIKHNHHLLSVLNINNMVPVPEEYYKKIPISKIKDHKYQDLLNMELNSCRKKKKVIIKNAKLVHQFICQERSKHKKMLSYCCDFNKLEVYYNKILKK